MYLSRRVKNAVHFACIALVGIGLLHEGGGYTDYAFLILAIACEVA